MPCRWRCRPVHKLCGRRRDARPVPSRFAQYQELDALCSVLVEHGRMLQIVPEFYDTDITIARIDQLAESSLKHNIPTTLAGVRQPSITAKRAPHWPGSQNRPPVAHGFGRRCRRGPSTVSFSLTAPKSLFCAPAKLDQSPPIAVTARIAALRDPATADKLVADVGEDGGERLMGRLIVRGGGEAPAPRRAHPWRYSIRARRGSCQGADNPFAGKRPLTSPS